MSGRRAILLIVIIALAACAPASGEEPNERAVLASTELLTEPATPAPALEKAPVREAPAEPARAPLFAYAGELTQGGWIRGKAPLGAASVRLGERELALDAKGEFFAAFDRDAGTQEVLVATLEDGREVRDNLTISPREWNIQRINLAKRAGGSSASFMARRRPELDKIWDARTAEADSDGWSQDFVWPVTGRISGHFGRQRIYRGEPGSYHSGIDIAVPSGTPFVAPASGLVTLASRREFSLEGQIIIIDHGAGLNSAFIHLSDIAVSEGDFVEQGQLLGRIGSSGRATGPHLHWSLKWHDTRLDPYLFVGPMP